MNIQQLSASWHLNAQETTSVLAKVHHCLQRDVRFGLRTFMKKVGIGKALEPSIDDALQLTLLTFVRKGENAPLTEYVGWLHHVARQHFIDILRKEQRRRRYEISQFEAQISLRDVADYRDGADPSYPLLNREFGAWLHAELADDDPSVRALMLDDESSTDVAARMGERPNTLRVRLCRTRQRLSEAVEELL